MSGNAVLIMMRMSMMRMMVAQNIRSKQESKQASWLSRGVGPLVSPSAALPLCDGVLGFCLRSSACGLGFSRCSSAC